MVSSLFFLLESALRHYFVNENFSKSKKIRAASLWNYFPWLYNVFQVGEV